MNNIEIAILSPRPEHDTDIAKRLDLKIFTYKNVLRKSIPNAILKIFFKWTPVENDTVLDAYEWADCIIDIHGINFSDSDTLISTAIIPSAQILLAALLKKPLIKFTQTFGPMKRVSIKIS